MRIRTMGLVVWCLLWGVAANGDITLDNFTSVTTDDLILLPDAGIYRIEERLGRRPLVGDQPGPNLFHSFFSFSLDTGETALFSQDPGTAPINNVIARVSGGLPSEIHGAIESRIAGADFWFVNPAGVLLGEEATVNVGGSFNLSVGDFIVMGEGTTFEARADTPMLSVTDPREFGFLAGGSGIGTLTMSGTVLDRNAEGQGFTGVLLHGHTVTLNQASILADTRTAADGGDIRLQAHDIALNGNTRLDASTEGLGHAGSVTLQALDTVTARGLTGGRVFLSTAAGTQEGALGGAGQVLIEAGDRVDLQFTDLETRNFSSLAGAGAGRIEVRARDGAVALQNTDLRGAGRFAASGTDISIEGRDVTLLDTRIFSGTQGSGDGGAVRIVGAETISLDATRARGTQIGSRSTARDIGDEDRAGAPGAIEIESGGRVSVSQSLLRAGTVSSNPADQAPATISITGSEILLQDSRVESDTTGTQTAGAISLTADTITVRGERIRAISGGPGTAGDIVLQARGTIELSDTVVRTSAGDVFAIQGEAEPRNLPRTGRGGNISIAAADITVTDGTEVLVTTGGPGRAGTIALAGDRITVGQSTVSAQTTASGDAGDIRINGAETVVLEGATVIASTGMLVEEGDTIGTEGDDDPGGGRGGDILINAGTLNLVEATRIETASTGSGAAGAVRLAANAVTGRASLINARTTGSGDAGDIFVAGADTVVLDAMTVETSTGLDELTPEDPETPDNIEYGRGGDIQISGGDIVLEAATQLNASTRGSGTAGSVSLEAVRTVSANGDADARILLSSGTDEGSSGGAGSVVLEGGERVDLLFTDLETRNFSTVAGSSTGSIEVRAPDGAVRFQNTDLRGAGRFAASGSDIAIEGREVALLDTRIFSGTQGSGDGGAVRIVGAEFVSLDASRPRGTQIGSRSTARDIDDEGRAGAPGAIQIESGGRVSLTGALIRAGTVSSNPEAQAPARIAISGAEIVVQDTRLESDTTGTQRAGSISLTADTIAVRGERIRAISGGPGDAGDIVLTSRGAIVLSETVVRTSAGEPFALPGEAKPRNLPATGNGGNITIAGTDMVIDGETLVAAGSSGTGDGGSVTFLSHDLEISQGSQVTTTATGAGDAGAIELYATGDLALRSAPVADLDARSAVLTQSAVSAGGDISAVVVGDLVLENSRIASSVADSDKDGGNIEVASGGLSMAGSQIQAGAKAGDGGKITIREYAGLSSAERAQLPDAAVQLLDAAQTDTGDRLFVIDARTLVNAESEEGVDGAIDISRPDVDDNAVIQPQSAAITDVPALGDSLCDIRSERAGGSLVQRARGGTRARPDDYLFSGFLDRPMPSTGASTAAVPVTVSAASFSVPLGCGR